MYCACTALSLRMSVLLSACAALADFLGDIKFLFNFFCIHLVTLNLCETNYFTTFVKVEYDLYINFFGKEFICLIGQKFPFALPNLSI